MSIDDEREALEVAVREALGLTATTLGVRRVVDSLADAGFRRQGPITDTQVKDALIAYYSTNGAWVSDKDHWINEFVPNMRAALEAARDAS